MNARFFVFFTLFLLPLASQAKPPNIILIFADDMGYNDLSCFGSTKIKTPHLDQLAREGRRLTNFHVPSSVCTPSRAALLTGCYPKRVSLHQHVLFPRSKIGLNPSEFTMAKHFQKNGYATTCIGKWHLGHYPETLPRAHGFDSYYGIPYSNDMNHPDNKGKINPASDENWIKQDEAVKKWHAPLVHNEEIIELPVNQRTITRRYTDKALTFIEANKDQPFFLYLPHSMPHIPLFVPEDVLNPNPKNAYTCTIEHLDAEVGRIIDRVKNSPLGDHTIIIFTSDNGPWIQYKNHGGSALPLRAGKGTPFEGGQRVPAVIWGPGLIPSGSDSDEFMTSMDLFPSLAALAKTPLELPKKIDGLDLHRSLTGDTPSARQEMLYYSAHGQLVGLRQNDWKLLINPGGGKKNTTFLFNLRADLSEKNNLAEQEADKVHELTTRMTELAAEITKNQRPTWTTNKAHPWPAKMAN